MCLNSRHEKNPSAFDGVRTAKSEQTWSSSNFHSTPKISTKVCTLFYKVHMNGTRTRVSRITKNESFVKRSKDFEVERISVISANTWLTGQLLSVDKSTSAIWIKCRITCRVAYLLLKQIWRLPHVFGLDAEFKSGRELSSFQSWDISCAELNAKQKLNQITVFICIEFHAWKVRP